MPEERWTGGCQCGAVRYVFSVRPDNPCICHCRMCQKQFGSFFGAFAGSHRDNFHVTRGEIAQFKSSDDAYRGFCRDCGTPLTYVAISRPRVDVAIGSLDRHSEMMPLFNYGAESMEPWLAEAIARPCTVTGTGDNGIGDTPERFELIKKPIISTLIMARISGRPPNSHLQPGPTHDPHSRFFGYPHPHHWL